MLLKSKRDLSGYSVSAELSWPGAKPEKAGSEARHGLGNEWWGEAAGAGCGQEAEAPCEAGITAQTVKLETLRKWPLQRAE